MENSFTKLVRQRPIPLAVWGIAGSVAASIVVFIVMGADDASRLGDAFGVAAALLAGAALLAVAVSIHDLAENQDQQQKQIDALAAIARALTDPVIVARIELRSDTAYNLFVENVGKSPAYDVRFEISPKEGLYPFDHKEMNLADLDFIKHGLPVMAPGQKIAAYIASGQDMGDKRKNGLPVVEEFTLTIHYHHAPPDAPSDDQRRKLRQYHYTFDFSRHQHTFQPRGEIAAEINRFRKDIVKGMEGGENKRFRVTAKKED